MHNSMCPQPLFDLGFPRSRTSCDGIISVNKSSEDPVGEIGAASLFGFNSAIAAFLAETFHESLVDCAKDAGAGAPMISCSTGICDSKKFFCRFAISSTAIAAVACLLIADGRCSCCWYSACSLGKNYEFHRGKPR